MANAFIFDDDEEPKPGQSSQEFSPDEEEVEEEGEEEGEGSNRLFLIIAIAIGAILLLTLICGAIFAFTVFLPAQNNARATQTEEAILAFNLTQSAQQTAVVQSFTATPTATDTPTPQPTATPVILFPTETPTTVQIGPETVTVQVLSTQRAALNLTSTAQATAGTTGTPGTPAAGARTPSPTALSQTGFADEVGLPGLFVAAVILLAVILLARRLRQSPLSR